MTRSTVLIVSADQTRTLHIDPRMLTRFKPVLWGLAFVSGGLAVALTVLGQRYLADTSARGAEIDQLREQVANLRTLTSTEINAKLAALKKSEQMIVDLQAYLRARGVDVKPVSIEPAPGQPNPAAGGPAVRASRPLPFTGSFARDTENLLETVQSIPLGLPHEGPLSSGFGGRSNPFTGRGSEHHGGLDFKGTMGEPVQVTAQGTVSFAGWRGGYGRVVEVGHAHGYTTLYGHLSRIDVRAGQTLSAGDTVGRLGSSGRSTGPHLHYEVLTQGNRVDPEQFLALNTPLSAR